LDYIETWGSGISRIINECKKKNVLFNIQEKGDFVEVTFSRPKTTMSDRRRPQATLSDRKDKTEKEIILDFLKDNGRITKKNVMELLNCKETKAKETLKELVNNNILEKVEKGKYTHYILKN
jgi:predicted HTH transcriptional regulator